MSQDGAQVSTDLFPEAKAVAGVIIGYTFINLLAAALTFKLFQMNGQKTSIIALLASTVVFSHTLAVVQELVSFALWPQVALAQYKYEMTSWMNAKTSIAYSALQLTPIKICFAARLFLFNVSSLLFFCWSLTLFVSVHGIKATWVRSLKFMHWLKIACFALPAVQTIFVNLPQVHAIDKLHIVISNSIIAFTVAVGSVFLLSILYKSIRARANARRENRPMPSDGSNARMIRSDTGLSKTSNTPKTAGLEDKWVILRFVAGRQRSYR
jgi:hypothetical protein